MLERLIRTAAVIASLTLLVSLGLFAIDQSGSASQQAQAEVNASGAETLGPPLSVGRRHSVVRRAIDDVSDKLESPFAALAPGRRSDWGYHLVLTGLGLLIYGFGLGALARSLALARLRPPPTPHSWSSGF
ncbi:MAG: hypothetical protein NVSMB51_18880 [Solirubrobacteraceae bacterium]